MYTTGNNIEVREIAVISRAGIKLLKRRKRYKATKFYQTFTKFVESLNK